MGSSHRPEPCTTLACSVASGRGARHILGLRVRSVKLKPKYIAAPLTSLMHDLAMEHGRDLHTHGEEYFAGALETSCIDGIGGFANVIDSLAAVKHLIYDTKKLTWDQLLDALENNWQGKEAIRQLCLYAPKYGNGIPSRTARASTCASSRSRSTCPQAW